MAAGDVWGNRWLASWGVSWAQAVEAPIVDSLRGRPRRRRWRDSVLVSEPPTAANVRAERKIIEVMLPIAEVEDLISEQKVLLGAMDEASGRQAKAISDMLARVERRIDEIIEDEEVVGLLIQ